MILRQGYRINSAQCLLRIRSFFSLCGNVCTLLLKFCLICKIHNKKHEIVIYGKALTYCVSVLSAFLNTNPVHGCLVQESVLQYPITFACHVLSLLPVCMFINCKYFYRYTTLSLPASLLLVIHEKA